MTRALIPVLLASLLTACGTVGGSLSDLSGGLPVTAPPEQYDHPFKGGLVVIRGPWTTVREICGALLPVGSDVRVDACQFMQGGTCMVVIPAGEGVSPEQTKAYLRHESGHCNGWPGHHPGARFAP